MIDAGEVRRRLVHRIERARKDAARRRTEVDAAARALPEFLDRVAAPVARLFVGALRAEGHLFSLSTPADAVRIVSDRSSDDFLELALDTDATPITIVGRTSLTRGRRLLTGERPLVEGKPLEALTQEDVLDFLLEEIGPFLVR